MSITFKARVLLELGAELISSDPVALYELIKNGVDAGSKKIGIHINIVMQPSSFRELVAMYGGMPEGQWSTQKFLRDVSDRIEDDAEDEAKAKFIELVGEPRKFSTAMERLKEAVFAFNYICIEDWGSLFPPAKSEHRILPGDCLTSPSGQTQSPTRIPGTLP